MKHHPSSMLRRRSPWEGEPPFTKHKSIPLRELTRVSEEVRRQAIPGVPSSRPAKGRTPAFYGAVAPIPMPPSRIENSPPAAQETAQGQPAYLRPSRRELVGVFGAPGSHSEEAALTYALREPRRMTLRQYIDPDELLGILELGRLDLAILPVYSSRTGRICAIGDAMGRHRFKVVDEVKLPVSYSLLVRSADTAPDSIQKVASQPMALVQCQAFLRQELPRRSLVKVPDPACAARNLAAGLLSDDTAVIAAERAAEVYRLHVAARHVEDEGENEIVYVICETEAR